MNESRESRPPRPGHAPPNHASRRDDPEATRPVDPYLSGLSATLTEWNSPEDEAAWRDL